MKCSDEEAKNIYYVPTKLFTRLNPFNDEYDQVRGWNLSTFILSGMKRKLHNIKLQRVLPSIFPLSFRLFHISQWGGDEKWKLSRFFVANKIWWKWVEALFPVKIMRLHSWAMKIEKFIITVHLPWATWTAYTYLKAHVLNWKLNDFSAPFFMPRLGFNKTLFYNVLDLQKQISSLL